MEVVKVLVTQTDMSRSNVCIFHLAHSGSTGTPQPRTPPPVPCIPYSAYI